MVFSSGSFMRDYPPITKDTEGGGEMKYVEVGAIALWWTINLVALEYKIVDNYAIMAWSIWLLEMVEVVQWEILEESTWNSWESRNNP